MEFKHICRLCSKKFPSGKSLGGHMRSHVLTSQNAGVESSAAGLQNKRDRQTHPHGGICGYKLRDNPKKTWRLISDYNNINIIKNNINNNCEKCGKGFKTKKALCGHMSIHSERDRNEDDGDDDDDEFDGSWCSESNINHSKPQTRSCSSWFNGGGGGGGGGGGTSSNQSEVDQLIEQEEVAMCLMMMSRDHHHYHSCVDPQLSSDDSVIIVGSDDDAFDDDCDEHYHGSCSRKKTRRVIDDSYGKKVESSSGKNSTEVVKGHKCPYCSKVFKSGQALGGHKRSHMVNSNGRLSSRVRALEPMSKPEHKRLDIDLNLPPPMEDDAW